MSKFYNYMNQQFTDDAVELLHGRWFIKIGFAGANTNRNNGFGFDTREAAEKTIKRYQAK